MYACIVTIYIHVYTHSNWEAELTSYYENLDVYAIYFKIVYDIFTIHVMLMTLSYTKVVCVSAHGFM